MLTTTLLALALALAAPSFAPQPTLHAVGTPVPYPGPRKMNIGYGSVRGRTATNDYAFAPWASTLDLDTPTLECFFRLGRLPSDGETMTIAGKGGSTYYAFKVVRTGSSYTLRFLSRYRANGSTAYVGEVAYAWTSPVAGRWYSAAVTVDGTSGGTLRAYLQARAFGTSPAESAYTLVGTNGMNSESGGSASNDGVYIAGGGSPVTGSDVSVTEIRIYSSALSKATLDSRLTSRLVGNESNLLAYWPADETGLTVTDRTANGHDGTFTGIERRSDAPPDLYYQ